MYTTPPEHSTHYSGNAPTLIIRRSYMANCFQDGTIQCRNTGRSAQLTHPHIISSRVHYISYLPKPCTRLLRSIAPTPPDHGTHPSWIVPILYFVDIHRCFGQQYPIFRNYPSYPHAGSVEYIVSLQQFFLRGNTCISYLLEVIHHSSGP